MSKKYLVPIDMNGLEIQNFLAHNLAAAPAAAAGKIYFNTVDKKLYYHNGTEWVAASGGSTYTGTTPINISGTTISHDNSGVTAASKGDTSNQTPAFGGTFKALSGTVDAKGHLTAFADHTVKIPETEATTSAKGLMSSTDKTKLDGINAGTQAQLEAGTDTADRIWQAKIIHDYIAAELAALPADQFLDLNQTTFVLNFQWSQALYPGSTDPNLDGKPVLVLALTDGTSDVYSFLDVEDLFNSYSGTAPIVVNGLNISISAATQSAAGSMSSTDKTKLDSITATKTGTVTISSGNTSVAANVADIISYTAKDAGTGEEVMLDVVKGSSTVTFSIAAAHTNAITITYLTVA